MPLTKDLGAALQSATLRPEDGAIRALAEQYAALIDEAVPAGRYELALTWLAQQGSDDRDADKHIRTIAQALAAHSVASDLGPKLLAALESLGMSPRARALVKGGKADVPPTGGKLDELRERRRARADRAAPVDATAQ